MNLILGEPLNLSIPKGTVLSHNQFPEHNWVFLSDSIDGIVSASIRLLEVGHEFETLYIAPPQNLVLSSSGSFYDHFDNLDMLTKVSRLSMFAGVLCDKFKIDNVVICASSKFNSPMDKLFRLFATEYLSKIVVNLSTDIFD